jgi:ferredoxin, 2Fe-2S
MTLMIVVDRDGHARSIDPKSGVKLMEILRDLDYGVAAICGGLCACATCHVYVDPSWFDRLPKPQGDEAELLKGLPDYRESASRLSCQVDFTERMSEFRVTIAPDS